MAIKRNIPEEVAAPFRLDVALVVISLSFVLATGISFASMFILKSWQEEPRPKAPIGRGVPGKVPNVLPVPSVVDIGNMSPVVDKFYLSQDDAQVILDRNLFNRDGTLGDTELEATKPSEVLPEQTDKILKSKLPLELSGVIYGGKPSVGLALIENKSKKRIASYLVGDEVDAGAILKEVYEERVVLNNRGRLEYLPLERKKLVRSSRDRKKHKAPEPSQPAISPLATGPVADSFKEEGFERSGGDIKISTAYREDLLGAKMSKVLSDAKAIPNMVGGELQGFKLTKIREDSIYQKAGFQSGDIIHDINGIPLRDAAGAIRLLQSLRNETEIEVRVQRGGDYFNMTIAVQ